MRFRDFAVGFSAAFFAFSVNAKTTFTVSNWVPPHHVLATTTGQWCQALEQESKGDMQCKILPKAVVAPPGTYDAISDGIADISLTVNGYTPGRFVFSTMVEFPFLGDSAEKISIAYNRIYEKYFAPLREHRGVKVLGVFSQGPGTMFNTVKPVKTMADARSLRFRTGGGSINELTQALGWNSVLRPATEVYELLSTGVIDGAFFTDESVKSFNLNTLKFATTVPGGFYNVSFIFMMNQDRFDGLRPDQKAIINKLSGEYVARLFGAGWDKVDAAARDTTFKTQGIQTVGGSEDLINAIKDKQGPIEEKWAKQSKAAGLADPIAVLREFRAEIGKVQ